MTPLPVLVVDSNSVVCVTRAWATHERKAWNPVDTYHLDGRTYRFWGR